MKKVVYFMVTAVFLGAQILAIDVGVAKISMYRLSLGIAVALLLFQLVRNHPSYNIYLNFKQNQYKFVYICWLIFGVVSVLWVESLSHWIRGVFFIGCGILSILLISTVIKTESDLKKLFIIIFIMIGMHQLIGWSELITNHYFWANMSGGKYEAFKANIFIREPYSIFTNTNDYSTLLTAGIPVSLIVLSTSKYLKFKIIAILSLISTFILLVQTGSRGNQLAVLVFFITLIGFKFLNRKTIKVLTLIISLLTVTFLISYLVVPSVRQVVYNFINTFINGSGSNVYRLHMLVNGLIYLARSFGLGVGAGNIEYWLVNDPVFEVDAPNIHNWFMEILVGYGIPMFILYIVMYIYISRQLFMTYKYSENPFKKKVSLYLFAYLICFIFSSISSASNIVIEWQWVFWGVIIAFVQHTEQQSEPLSKPIISERDSLISNKSLHQNEIDYRLNR